MAARDPTVAVFKAAREGDAEEVAWWLNAHPGLLETKGLFDVRPLLYEAADNGHAGVVRTRLGKGAAVNSENRYGQRPLFAAARGNHTEVVALLLGAGAELSQRFKSGTRTALHAACSPGSTLCTLAVTRLLLKHMRGEGLDAQDNLGETALILACEGALPDVTRALLVAGADQTIVNNKGRTARSFAVTWWWGACPHHYHPCAAVFKWWDGEMERAYAFQRARRVHQDSISQAQGPGASVPTYLGDRAIKGDPWPRVEVTARQEGEEEEEEDGPLDDDGAIIKYAIEDLPFELYTELWAGFHN